MGVTGGFRVHFQKFRMYLFFVWIFFFVCPVLRGTPYEKKCPPGISFLVPPPPPPLTPGQLQDRQAPREWIKRSPRTWDCKAMKRQMSAGGPGSMDARGQEARAGAADPEEAGGMGQGWRRSVAEEPGAGTTDGGTGRSAQCGTRAAPCRRRRTTAHVHHLYECRGPAAR